jgi:TP901 family phage tail tape measure protein
MIGGNIKRAEAALRELQRTGHDVSNRLERDFSALGTQSSTAFNNKRKAATQAYDRIKSSGTATADELIRAEEGLSRRLKEIDKDQYGERISLAEKFRANWVKITAAAAAAGYAGYRLARKSLDEFTAFETSLTDLGKVTSESLEDVRKKIMDLPPELGSATELVQGYYQTISAGVTDPKEAMDLLVIAAKAAKAAHVDQSDTIKAITKMMAGYSGEIKNAAEASDLLFAIEAKGQTTVKELVPIIGNISSLSHQAGVNQNEMAAAMAQLTQTAGSTSEAATQYQGILRALIKPTKSMEEALKALGYESGEAAVEQEGFAGVLLKLKEHSEKSGVGLGKLFESSEALVGLGPLLSDEADGYNESLKAMEESAGATEDAFDRWRNTFKAVFEAFDNTIGKLLIDIGEELAPTAMDAMQDLTDWMNNNRDTISEFVKNIGDALAWTAEQLGKLMSQVNTTVSWYQAFQNDQIGFFEWAFTGNDAAARKLQQISSVSSAQSSIIVGRSDGPLFPGSGFAVGTSYVPATGYYRLHRGEEVRNRSAARSDNRRGDVTISPVIQIDATGSRGGIEQSAREIARLIMPELQALGQRYRTT